MYIRDLLPQRTISFGIALWLLLAPSISSAEEESKQPNAFVVITNDVFQQATRTIQVLSSQVLRDEGYLVQDPAELQVINPPLDLITDLGKKSNAGHYLSIEALPLQTKYIVTFSLGRTADHQIIRSRQVTMTHLDEADTILKRGIRSLIRNEKVEETADLKSITKDESKRFQKKKGEFLVGLGLSGGLGLNEDVKGYYGALARLVFSTESFRINLDLTGLGGNQGGVTNFSLGGGYTFLPDENISPYVGFDAGWGHINTDEDDNRSDRSFEGDGLLFGLSAGMEFLRFYEVRLLTEFRVLFPGYEQVLITEVVDPLDPFVERVEEGEYQPIGVFNMVLLF
jgi:hypothetical protein